MPVTKKQKKGNGEIHPLIGTSKKSRTYAQFYADAMTKFMGSWKFIFLFAALLCVWIGLNVIAWVNHWDPYPFILLNLFLSTISAFQAPIIMMSKNRQTERDRITAQYDYAVNRKAEREIQQIQKELAAIRRLLQKMNKK